MPCKIHYFTSPHPMPWRLYRHGHVVAFWSFSAFLGAFIRQWVSFPSTMDARRWCKSAVASGIHLCD